MLTCCAIIMERRRSFLHTMLKQSNQDNYLLKWFGS